MNFSFKMWLILGAILGGLAVALGAFAAHALKGHFTVAGVISSDNVQRLANWETAVRYQMYHALALLAVGFLAARQPSVCINIAGIAFLLGTLIFSGCLYLLVLTGQRWLGAVVPIGGTLLIVGWVSLAVAASRLPLAAD